jgi:uncharacterized protein (DUF1697 family)
MTRYVALLRAVNVGGRKVTMAELKQAAEAAGYGNPRTLVASGNLVFDARKTAPAKLEAALETLIEKTFGLFSEVMVRDPDEWAAILEANPFPEAAKSEPARLVCTVCKHAPDAAGIAAWLKTFREKYDRGERLKIVGREIFIDYRNRDTMRDSKLILPKKFAAGTGRNWNTMLKLDAMLND